MQTGSTPVDKADEDGFQRWWLGGAPGIDDDDGAVSALSAPAEERAPTVPAPERAREGWFAAAGGIAAAVLLWSFYGVVDGAVERGARAEADVPIAAQAAPLEAGAGAVQVEAAHAVYTLPPGGEQLFYTRWR